MDINAKWNFDVDEENDVSEKSLEKNKHRAKRRRNSVTKALRKRRIAEHNYGFAWYDNLHQYSKNKVHCSCNLCRFRSKFNPKQKTYSDMKKILKTDYSLKMI